MESDNEEIPGFGFDPGFEPSPLPQQPAQSSNSIFGLISKVNKGILKKTQTSTSESGLQGPANPSVQQARAVAKKLSNISPQIAKQRVFQNAKTAIENIQKGIWKPPVAEQNKPGSSKTGFKVPTVAPGQKQVDVFNKGQGHGKVASQSQTASISKSHVYHDENILVAYKDTDRTKQTSSFSRQEALEEIDRYRLPARGYNKDQRYEETRKKAEPFKSDFDRYYYGNETQRSEIAGKLHRADDFGSEREFVSKQFQERTQRQDTNLGRELKNIGDAKSRVQYQLGSENAQKPRYGSYQSPGSDNYQRSGKDNYGRPVTEIYQTKNDNYEHKSFASDSKNCSVGNEHGREDEYDPERWDYGRNRECVTNESKSYQSRGMETGSFDNRPRNEKPVSVDKYQYKSDYNAYLKDTRSRNMEPDLERLGSKIKDMQARPESGSNVTITHSVDSYGNMLQTHDGEMSYKASRQIDEREQGFDSYRYSYERHNRDINRDRDRDEEDERGSYSEARGQQSYSEGKNYYNDEYYDSGRGDRYDYRTEEYGEDMANMEEFPEGGEHDSKSQDGGMLYEDFLFGEGDEEEEKSPSAEQRLNANKGYTSRQFDDKIDRKTNVEDKIGMTKNETYDMSRNIGSERRDSRGRDMQQATNRINSRANFGERKIDHAFELAGRGFAITDDQKAQVGKPVTMWNPAQVPHLTGTQAEFPPVTSVLVRVPPPAGVPIQVPIQTGVPTQVPPPAGVPTRVPFQSGVPTGVPVHTGIPTQVLTRTGIPAQVLTQTGIPTQVQTLTGIPTQVLTPTGIPTGLPTVTGVPAQVPPPTGVPAPPVTVTALIPPPGIICKDCNVTCLDEEIYKAHMKSNMHILTLQTKAQELFHMDARKSRFDVDSTGKPLKASILPPTTMITGIPTNTLAKPVPGIQLGRNVFSGDASPEIKSRRDSPTRYRPRSDSDLQVIPPKPLGPLETRSVQGTWLILQWRTRHGDEEALIDKYVVEYRNARETRWVTVGETIKHEFEVNGLQEGTDYLFRVYTTNRDERSEYLESILITTKKRRDSIERERRIPGRERERDRGHRSSRDRDRRSSREIDRKSRRKVDRQPIENRKIGRDRKHNGDKKPSRDIEKIGRDNKPTKGRDNKPVKKISSIDSKQNKASKTGDNEKNSKLHSAVKNTEEKLETMAIDKPEEAKQEDVECLLYKELPNYASEPLLGLDNIYEIRSYLPKTPPRYVCKLCNNKGSHKIIVKHIIGFPHKLNYFQKHNPEIYDIINVIALKKQQVERANYEARLEEDRIGRGSVRVMLMLNPQDNNGKLVYSDPIPVKAPPPVRKKEIGEVPEAYDGNYQSQFEAFYNQAIESGALSDSTLIGLDYVKEILHPKMEKEPKYTCSLCSVLCYSTTILWHLVGKKHRFNYLKVYQEDVYDMISNAKEQKHELLLEKIKELAEKDGPGTIKTKVARNERMWRDRASRAGVVQAETQGGTEVEGNIEEPKEQEEPARESRSTSAVQAIKFDIKKTESQPTSVKPINVLDQEQAVPKHKEAFDWSKENSLLQSRIHNETIIKSSRKSKFLTVYSEFFRRYPVIGMQWVTEFQKQDVKQEPWYMCFMCQQKLQWKSILDHATSNLHRLNYMKKSDYRQMYNAVYHAIKKEKQSARPLIEQYSKEISSIEGPPTEIEVMLELNINKEAFKSVAKLQENVKAHAAASSVSSSIQINIASVSVTSAKVSGDSTSTSVQVLSEPKTVATYMSNAPAQDTKAQNNVQDLQHGSLAQQYNLHTPQTVHAQMQQKLQPLPLPAPLMHPPPPLMHPPPLHPSQSGTISKNPPPNIHTNQAQRFPMAVVPSSPMIPIQSVSNSAVTMPPPAVLALSHFAPPLDNISATPGGPSLTLPVPFNPNTVTVRQPLISGLRYRPPHPSSSIQRPPLMPCHSQMGKVLPQRPKEANIAFPLSVQEHLIQGKSTRSPIYSSLQTSISSTTVISRASPVVLSTAQHPNLQDTTDLKAKRPPPWQIQTLAAPIASLIDSSPQQDAPRVNINSSSDNRNSNVLPQFNISSHFRIRDDTADSSESVHNNKKKNHSNERQDFDQKQPLCAASGNDTQVFKNIQHNILHDDGSSRDDFRDSERGIKRYGRETGHNDRNKRRRNEDRVNVIKTEKKMTSQLRSSYGRSSQEYDSRRQRDLAKGDGRDRRRSRSPYRSDRRSPPRTRQRDNNFGEQTDRFTRRSERMPSPNRQILDKDRQREIYPENRREQSYVDDQIPTEDYNMPLDEARVEDLVRLYSDRIDDDYDNVVGNEAEWDNMMDNRFDDDRRDDFESYNERYYHERQTLNEYDRDGNSGDGWYQKDARGRSDYRHSDRFGENEDSEYRDISNKYNQYPKRDSDRNQSIRDRGFIERGHISEDRRERDDMQRVDRYRERTEKQKDHFFREAVDREGEYKSSEGEWRDNFQEEDSRRQREFSRDYLVRQNYRREERPTTYTFGSRRVDNRAVPVHRQRYEDDYERMFDDTQMEDDGLPDPSREEIDALLRRAVNL